MPADGEYSPIVVDRADPATWDAAVSAFPERTVFHSLPWLRALARARQLDFVLLAARRGTRLEALWPCFVTRRGGLRVAGSPLPATATPYLGPLFHPDADADVVLRALLAEAPLRRASYLACRVMERIPPVDLSACGFSRQRRFETPCLDLTRSEEELWQGLKSECRGRVRRAQKLGVDVRREESDDFLDDYWRMTVETFSRSGSRPTHTRDLVREIWRELRPAGQLLVLSAFLDGRRIAVAVLPHDDRALYYWGGAASDAERSIPSANLLQWRAIVEGRSLGLATYDMISADGGSGRFKRTFGAEDVCTATHWDRSASPWVSTAKGIYERYTRVRLGLPRPTAGARAPANPATGEVAAVRMRSAWSRLTARVFSS